MLFDEEHGGSSVPPEATKHPPSPATYIKYKLTVDSVRERAIAP